SGPTQAIVDCLVVRRVGRPDRVKGSVGLGGVQTKANFTKRGNHVFFAALNVGQLERQKVRLRIGENILHRRELDEVSRIARAECQTLTAIDHSAAEAQDDCGNAVVRVHRRHWIEVIGAHDSGEIRIKTLVVGGADHLLENDGHFFFFQPIRRRAHVCLRVLAEGGCVHPLDRFYELLKTYRQVGIVVGEHERFVDAGEGLVLRIFQQAGGTHGQRIADFRKKFQQIVAYRRWKRRLQEALFNFAVVGTLQRKIRQVVLVDEPIENVGSQNNRGWNCHTDSGEQLLDAVFIQQMAHEGQAARLTSQRSVPNAQEKSVGGSESPSAEVSYQHVALFAPIVGDGRDQVAAQVLGAIEL